MGTHESVPLRDSVRFISIVEILYTVHSYIYKRNLSSRVLISENHHSRNKITSFYFHTADVHVNPLDQFSPHEFMFPRFDIYESFRVIKYWVK